MRRIGYLICFFILFTHGKNSQLFSQSTGLSFLGQQHTTNTRTSLSLFTKKPWKTSNHFSIEFDFALEKNYSTYFGYIFRAINSEGKNIDLIAENGEDDLFIILNVIIGDATPILSLTIRKDYLYQWNKIKLDFDIINKSYSLTVGDFHIEEKGDFLPLNNKLQIFFGVNQENDIQTTDLPNMKIRDIVFSRNHKVAYHWPLNNHEGNESYDIINNKKASIINPVWLHKHHVEWKLAQKYFIESLALLTFNQQDNQFYIVSSDSLFIFSTETQNIAARTKFSKKFNLSKGQGIVYDTMAENLVLYSADQKLISRYDRNNNTWSNNIQKMPYPSVFWHHNKFIDPLDSTLKIIGGYGMHQYKNIVQSVDLTTENWNEYEPEHSDFHPRYLSGLGLNKTADSIYILGGYGSFQGDQKLQPKYWYELFRFIPSNKKFEQVFLYEDLDIDGFCFANSMIIQDNDFYALGFSKFDYNNYLQLYKGSLISNYFEPYSEKIPFNFHDIMTFVDLHFSPTNKKLYCSISFINDKLETDIKVYEINFPPEKQLTQNPIERSFEKIILISTSLLLLIIAVILIYKRIIRNRQAQVFRTDNQTVSDAKKPAAQIDYKVAIESIKKDESRKNQILLFGGFQIINGEGVDITAKFTPLLKELFLLIFLNTFGDRKGVTGEYLREMLWSDKSNKDAKNNRAVNMSKLKSILAEVGHSTLSKETGYWKINIDYSRVYVDYAYLYNILHSSSLDQEQMNILIEITRNKPFLKSIATEWLDTFKAEVSNDIVDKLIKWAMENVEKSDPSFIIPITEAVFEFDSLNEEAVELKCRCLVKLGKHSLAKSTYDSFVKNYKLLYDEDFHTPFNQLIS